MYAIIVTGGKQYKVQNGDVVFVEKLDVEADAEITFDKVLAVGSEDGLKAGAPYVDGATVRKSQYLLTNQRRTKSVRRVIVSHIQRLRLPKSAHNDNSKISVFG